MTIPFRFVAVLATVALAVGGTAAFADSGHGGRGGDDHGGHHHGRDNDRHGGKVLQARLVGSTPLSAATPGPVLFGANPGGLPWVVGDSKVSVRRDRVKVRVEGLVIPTAPQNGTNPVSNLAASVYCNGTLAATTAAVAFSTAGDARIDEDLATPLPSPCLAPAVLINPAPGGTVNTATYIAASGA